MPDDRIEAIRAECRSRNVKPETPRALVAHLEEIINRLADFIEENVEGSQVYRDTGMVVT